MRRRVGRPGLVGTMARTAVVAGTATAVAGGVSRHQAAKADQAEAEADEQQQQQQMAAQQAAAAPAAGAPAAGGALDPAALAQIEQLAQMKESGALTEEEFTAAKAKILGG
jgi:hypothetical protein